MDAGRLLKSLREARQWSQSTFALAIGISPSLLNELENGKRLISSSYLSKIENAHVIDIAELRILREQAAVDLVQKKFQMDLKQYFLASLEGITELLDGIYRLRLNGQTGILDLLAVLVERIKCSRELYPRDRKTIDRLWCKSIIERIEIQHETLPAHMIYKLVSQDMPIMKSLCYALSTEEDIEAFELAMILPALVCYVAGDFEISIRIFKERTPYLSSSYTIAHSVRDSVVGTAILHSQRSRNRFPGLDDYLRVEENALKALNDKNIQAIDRAFILEGIAYAHVLLNLHGTSELLDRAGLEYDIATRKNGNRVVVQAGIARTRFLSLVDLCEDLILPIAYKTLSSLDGTGYSRIRSQVANKLLSHHNELLREYGEAVFSRH